MPIRLSASRWLLPLGATALALVAFIPAGADAPDAATSAFVASPDRPVAPAEMSVAAEETRAPQVDETAVFLHEDKPAWIAAVTTPRPYAESETSGWLPAADAGPLAVTEAPVAASIGQLMARTALNVRSGPSTSAAKLFVLSTREEVNILATEGSWSRVRTQAGAEGWAWSAHLVEPGTPIVDAPPRRTTTASAARATPREERQRTPRRSLFDVLSSRGAIDR